MSDPTVELDTLAADLEGFAVRLPVALAPVVSKGALNIKNGWCANASGNRHAPHYPASIGYDLDVTPASISAVIGPDKNLPQGPLGNILEFGTSKNPPHNDGGRALAAEEPRFISAVEQAAAKAVLGE